MGCVICFDYGKRYIGVAVGELSVGIAETVTTVNAKKGVPVWEEIDDLMTEWQPERLALGYPMNMDGSEQNLGKAVMKFKDALEARYQKPCHLIDERLSTYQARKVNGKIKSKAVLDANAAKVILQSWFDDPKSEIDKHET